MIFDTSVTLESIEHLSHEGRRVSGSVARSLIAAGLLNQQDYLQWAKTHMVSARKREWLNPRTQAAICDDDGREIVWIVSKIEIPELVG